MTDISGYENHGSRRIKHLFLVSRKIILQNHDSRGKNKPFHISREKKKGPITSHENTLSDPPKTTSKVS